MQVNFEDALSVAGFVENNKQESRKKYQNNDFKTKRSPKPYLENMHTEKIFPVDYVCQLCDKGFPTKSEINMHKMTHNAEKPVIFTNWDNKFQFASELSSHERTSTVYKTLKCSHCYKSFSKLWKLNRHKIIHTGEKPFGCNKCDRSF